MREILINRPKLIAFNEGISPLCKPMVCGDLVGPQSYFGESARIPRPIRPVSKGDFTISDPEFLQQVQSNAVVLWEKSEAKNEVNHEFAVPVTTFLAGACDSTFSLAWELAEYGMLTPFSGVLSIFQEAARGQMRKHWASPRGNLSVSFLLPASPSFAGESCSIILGMIIAKALNRSGYELFLKWPNDLITASNRKCGGILIEERNNVMIAGLGINIQEVPRLSEDAKDQGLLAAVLSSASTEDKEEAYAPFLLWQSLVENMMDEYANNVEGKNPKDVVAMAEDLLAWKGRDLVVVEGNTIINSGVCKGLSDTGGIVLDNGLSGTSVVYTGHIRLSENTVSLV